PVTRREGRRAGIAEREDLEIVDRRARGGKSDDLVASARAVVEMDGSDGVERPTTADGRGGAVAQRGDGEEARRAAETSVEKVAVRQAAQMGEPDRWTDRAGQERLRRREMSRTVAEQTDDAARTADDDVGKLIGRRIELAAEDVLGRRTGGEGAAVGG